MRLDNAGLKLIQNFEGWSPVPYLDEAGLWSIGWGHLIRTNEAFTRITTAEGDELLRNDVQVAERAVNDLIAQPMNQNQFNAMVSLTYNIGRGGFERSTVRRKFNQGDINGAMEAFSLWNKVTKDGRKIISAGLIRRRVIEAKTFIA